VEVPGIAGTWRRKAITVPMCADIAIPVAALEAHSANRTASNAEAASAHYADAGMVALHQPAPPFIYPFPLWMGASAGGHERGGSWHSGNMVQEAITAPGAPALRPTGAAS
jgi:hypothetical protein